MRFSFKSSIDLLLARLVEVLRLCQRGTIFYNFGADLFEDEAFSFSDVFVFFFSNWYLLIKRYLRLLKLLFFYLTGTIF